MKRDSVHRLKGSALSAKTSVLRTEDVVQGYVTCLACVKVQYQTLQKFLQVVHKFNTIPNKTKNYN